MRSETGQYFEDRPNTPSAPRSVNLHLPDLTTTLESDSGIFSANSLDPGTRFLLLDAPPIKASSTHIADLGCGYGPIARTMAHRAPQAHVWAIDINQRALALSTRNLSGLNATAVLPNGVPSEITIDVIWSNPPIRIGKPALRRLLTFWLDRLEPKTGYAVFVVSKHLGGDSLAHWLTSQGWDTTRLSSHRGYRLLRTNAR